LKDKNKDKIGLHKVSTQKFAESFLRLAEAGRCVNEFEGQFYELKNALIGDLDLKTVLSDNSIEKSERIKTAFKILGPDASFTLKAVFSVIITMDLVEHVEDIFNEFIILVNIAKRQILVEVVSSFKLDADTITKIKQSIDKKTGMDVRIKNIIDDSVIGGIIIKIGEKIIDLSIKGKLKDLKTRLKSLDLGGA